MYGKPRGTSRPNNYDVFSEDPENLVKQGNVVKEYNKFYQPQYAVRFIPDRSESAQAYSEAFGVGIGEDGRFSEANITPEQRARMVAFYNNPANYGPAGVLDPNGPAVAMLRPLDNPYDVNTTPNLTGNYGEYGRYEKFRQEQLAKRKQELAANPLTRDEAMRTGRVGEWMAQEQKAYAQQPPVRPQQPVSLPLQVMPVAQPEPQQGSSPVENALLNAITRQMEGPRGRWVMSGNAPQAVRAQFHEMRAQDDRGGPGLNPQLVGAAAEFARLQAAREEAEWGRKQADLNRPFGILEAAAGLSGVDPEASKDLMQRGMDMLREQGAMPAAQAQQSNDGISNALRQAAVLQRNPLLEMLKITNDTTPQQLADIVLKRAAGPGAMSEADYDVLREYVSQRQKIDPESFGRLNPARVPDASLKAMMEALQGSTAAAILKTRQEMEMQRRRDFGDALLQSAFQGW